MYKTLVILMEKNATKDTQNALRAQRKETARPAEESEKCCLRRAAFLLGLEQKGDLLLFFCSLIKS